MPSPYPYAADPGGASKRNGGVSRSRGSSGDSRSERSTANPLNDMSPGGGAGSYSGQGGEEEPVV